MAQQIEVPGLGLVEFPDGMSDADIVAAIRRSMPKEPAPDPTEGMSGAEKFFAGAGKAFYDIGRGVGNLVTDVVPGAAKYGFATRSDVDEANKRDAALMNTGTGVAGNVIGNLAAYAPLAFVPGAATVGGGAAIGGVTGFAQPVGTGDSRIQNTMVGTAAGAAVPAAIRTAKALRAGLVDPFTEAGRNKIAGSVVNRAAADPAAVSQRLRTVQGATPGFVPTAGQAADDAGVAALERTMRAIDPKGFDAVDKAQRQVLADAVRGVAGDKTARGVAVKKREEAVEALYDKAKSAVVNGDAELEQLFQRPTIASGLMQAEKIAADEGRKFALSAGSPERTTFLGGQTVKVPGGHHGAKTVQQPGLLDASGNPITVTTPAAPSTYSGQSLHDMKLGIDAAITEGSGGIAGRATGSQLAAKNAYLDWLERKIPEYGLAKQKYAELSKPINQMDIGQEFAEKLIPALYRDQPSPVQLNAAAYAKALTDQGDDIARSATGFKGATLDGVMSPEQMTSLRGVAKDLEALKTAEVAGRGVGSDTVQKISMTNLAAEAGVPNWLASIARVPGGWAKRAGDVLYGSSDEQIRARLAEILRNPQEAAEAMRAAGATPSQIAEVLKLGGQGIGLTAFPVLNANK